MAGGGASDHKTARSEPNVVPLCDILLVLLIIFMVVTPMVKKGANVAIPEATNSSDQPEPGTLITVNVTKDGKVVLEGGDQPLVVVDPANGSIETQLDKLGPAIEEIFDSKEFKERKVLMKADVEVEYGTVVDVMDEIREAQVEMVGLITESKTS